MLKRGNNIVDNKKREYAIITFIIILTLIICSYLIFNVINILRYRAGRPEDIIYTNNMKGDIDYQVYLKPNNFVDAPYVTNDFSFAAPLVDYIDTLFSYDYVGTSNIIVDYDYYIKASIISRYASEDAATTKPLWIKDFILLDHQKGTSNDSKIRIAQHLKIGIDYYNNLLDDFNKSLNIPLNSRLDIALVVKIKGKLENDKTIDKEHLTTMSIPLGVKVFDIDITKSYPKSEITYRREPKKAEVSYMIAILYIVLIIVIGGTAFYLIKSIINRGKGEYLFKVSKLLKEYDDRIVNVSNFIRYEKLEIVDIPNFDELLTYSDETLEPIIFWEKRSKGHIEAWFCIVRDKMLFRYIISYDRQVIKS
jgi:uncharacterized protein (UPF0333 family)